MEYEYGYVNDAIEAAHARTEFPSEPRSRVPVFPRTAPGSRQTPKRRKGKLRTVIAACLAVIVLGGASGFGGAYLWNGINGILNGGERENGPVLSDRNAGATTEELSIAEPDVLVPPSENDRLLSKIELYEKVSDSVVGIKISYRNGGYGNDGVVASGVIYTTDGYVITCAHVVVNASKVYVVVNDYADPEIVYEYEAEVLGMDNPTDLAVLKIKRDEPFKASAIGSSGDLKIGQDVCAVGNPAGLSKTLTDGIVSGLQRGLGDNTYELPSIQTNAAVNGGNSGGPLYDMYGNVVGIVNKKIVYNGEIDNLGFAISIDEAKPIIDELVKNGSVTSRARLGISAKEVNSQNAFTLGVDVEKGLYVDSVTPGTSAAESGLTRGDVIIKIDGKDVATIADVQGIIKFKSAGDMVEVTVVRYDKFGEKEELKIKFKLTASS
ncbi:MAG: trypsin-like peptidase domain-containing protein [Oscillospiraceae bacterium]|jgi:serine protease Do|nr:trypsin-like peptidase domain-containing protein [Oscillospiraceae bacterium]